MALQTTLEPNPQLLYVICAQMSRNMAANANPVTRPVKAEYASDIFVASNGTEADIMLSLPYCSLMPPTYGIQKSLLNRLDSSAALLEDR